MSEKKTIKLFTKFLKKFDYFGVEMRFSINQKEKYRSKLGGSVFLIYFIIALIFFFQNFYHFAWRNVQTLSFSSKVLSPTPPIYLNTTNLTFSIGVKYNDNFTSARESYSKYLEYNIDYSGYIGEHKEYKYIELPTALCNRSDFQSISDITFVENNLEETICPIFQGSHSDLVIQGDFTDTDQSFIIIKVSLKDEILNDSKLYAEFKKFLNENPIIVQLYLVDTKVDYEEYYDYLGDYLTVTNSYASLNQVKFYEISLSKLIFRSDNNILWQNSDERTSIMLSKSDYNSYSIEDRDKINVAERKVLNQFFIKSTSKTYYYERNYQKLTDFLANMTGILSQLFLIIILVMRYLNDRAARRKVMKKVMKFKSEKNNLSDIFSRYFKNEVGVINNFENFQNFNPYQCKIKKEDEISKNDIQIEMLMSPTTEKGSNDAVKSQNSHRSEKNQSNEERYSNYECLTENIPINIVNTNNYIDIPQYQNNRNNDEINKKIIPSINYLETVESFLKIPENKNNLSENIDIINKNSPKIENLTKDNLKLGKTEFTKPCSLSHLNIDRSKTKFNNCNKNQNFENMNTIQSSNPKMLLASDNLKDLKESSTPVPKIKNNLLKLSLWEKVKVKIFCQKISRKDLLLKMAGEKMFYYMDVINYIKMKEEFSTLKEILFNDTQMYLFDFLSKPIIDDKIAKLYEKNKLIKPPKFNKIKEREVEGLYKNYERARSQDVKINENHHRLIKKIEEQVVTMSK